MFEHNDEVYNTNSAREIVPFLLSKIQIKSVVDFGCGIGTWLKIFKDFGVDEIQGVEQKDINFDKLEVPNENVYIHDLSQQIDLGKSFDLVVSLEVAEHIDEKYSHVFIENLVKHGEIILFSAAMPGQGGDGHINEQYPEYWASIFKKFDFELIDVIRTEFWFNENIEWWYKQNMFIAVKNNIGLKLESKNELLAAYHPDLFNFWKDKTSQKNERIELILNGGLGIKGSLRILKKAIKIFFYGKS